MSATSEAVRRAWATRRERYGQRGHRYNYRAKPETVVVKIPSGGTLTLTLRGHNLMNWTQAERNLMSAIADSVRLLGALEEPPAADAVDPHVTK